MDFWAVLTWQAGGKYTVPCAKLGAVSVLDRLRARAGKFASPPKDVSAVQRAAAARNWEEFEWVYKIITHNKLQVTNKQQNFGLGLLFIILILCMICI
jgi:hypothetical protein